MDKIQEIDINNQIELENDNDSSWEHELVGQAYDIVASPAARLCIQAGPGTGKSYCMTKRILRLIQQNIVKPHEILAVTFTRVAAEDLRKTLKRTLEDKADGIQICTLHSLCLKIVKDTGYLNVRKRTPRFILSITKSACMNFEAGPMLHDLQYENSDNGTATDQSHTIREYEALWAKRQGDPLGRPHSDIEQRYGTYLLNWLKFHNAMLLGELIKESFEYLSAEPDSEWHTKFKAILVDEYQDLNKLDQEVISLLTQNKDINCAIVGDQDQSIYSFRCAHPEGLIEYSLKPDVEALTMAISRRCPTSHLNTAQALIHSNIKRAAIYPTAMAEAPNGEISVRRWTIRAAEIDGILNYISYCKGQGFEYNQMLIMTPSRDIGIAIRRSLNQSGILAHSYFAEELIDADEAQKALTLLKLHTNPKDRVSLRCWLAEWSKSSSPATYSKLRKYCENHNIEPWDALTLLVNDQSLIPGTKALIDSFKNLTSELQKISSLKGIDLVNSLFPDEDEWTEDIRTLLMPMIDKLVNPNDIYDFLSESITKQSVPTEVDHIRIMSLHKAKGLTCQVSILAGIIEGLIPNKYDPKKPILTESEHIEEQRRLLYVAMTRSTDKMLISSPRYVDIQFARKYGLYQNYRFNMIETIPSNFLSNIGLPRASSNVDFP